MRVKEYLYEGSSAIVPVTQQSSNEFNEDENDPTLQRLNDASITDMWW